MSNLTEQKIDALINSLGFDIKLELDEEKWNDALHYKECNPDAFKGAFAMSPPFKGNYQKVKLVKRESGGTDKPGQRPAFELYDRSLFESSDHSSVNDYINKSWEHKQWKICNENIQIK